MRINSVTKHFKQGNTERGNNMKFFGNDTIAILFIGMISIAGVVMKDSVTIAAGIGGLVGYIGGSKLSN